EKALARAIDEGRIRGAAIDAFEEEPLPADSPLRKLGDRVLLSPHSASIPRVASSGRAWPGPRARWSPRSRVAFRTMFTTGRSSRAGRSASGAPAPPAHEAGRGPRFGLNQRRFRTSASGANRLIFMKNQ